MRVEIGRLRHTRFEGNLAEVIAHEIAHFNSVRALGYRRHLGQPLWKSEGWAEYQANLAAIRADPDYDGLVAAMKAYKTDQRKHDIMKSLLMSKNDADLENIALFYALQKPDRAQTPPISGKPKSGEAAAAACAGCHGNQGVSGNPATPSLAGQDAQYLVIADQTPKPPNVRKPLTTAEWAQKCDRCHGINGNSTDPLSPALAGQRADYLEKVLHDYKTRTRKSPAMAAMSDVLGDVDIADLAAHYARQKPRSVVFVIP